MAEERNWKINPSYRNKYGEDSDSVNKYETDTEGWRLSPLLPRERIEELKTKSYYDKVRSILMDLRDVYYKSSNYELLQFLMKEYYTFKSEYESLVSGGRTSSNLDKITKRTNQIPILINLYRRYLEDGAYITDETRRKIDIFIDKLNDLLRNYKELLMRFYA